jgi:hypothetical protein
MDFFAVSFCCSIKPSPQVDLLLERHSIHSLQVVKAMGWSA